MSSSRTLGLIPGESTVFQQCHCNLSPLNIVSQPNKVKVSVELVYEPTHAHPIHRAFEVVGQRRLDRRRKALGHRLSRLSCQLLVSNCKISLQLSNLCLQVSNNLGNVNLLWL